MAYDKPWLEISWLMSETDKLYERIVAKGGRDKITATKDFTVKERLWEPSLSLIEKNFPRVVREIGYFYLPKLMQPGPMFVFPIRNTDGSYLRAQTRPLPGSVEHERAVEKDAKYMYIGPKQKEPSWLGNDRSTLQRIIDLRWCVLVEGPFDLVACRLVAPDVPTLCPLTKRIGGKHEEYLRILGVKKSFLLFDNEPTKNKEKHDVGEGNFAMRVLQKEIKTMDLEILLCPSNDPSAALKRAIQARQLRKLLTSL